MSNTIGYDLEGFANSSVTKLTGTDVTELGGSISIYTPFDSDINCTAHAGHLGYAAGNGVPRGNATIQTSVKKFGTGALYLDGTEDTISFPPTTIPSGVSAFTIEGWAYHLDSNACDIFSNNGTQTDSDRTFILHRRTTNYLEVILYSGGSVYMISEPSGISNNTWYHWAVTLSGGTLRLFKDGSLLGSTSSGNLDASVNDFHFGARRLPMSDDYHQHMNGYLDDIRILKGTASYTSSFTPPSSALGVGSSTLYLPLDDDFENDALSSPTTISTSVKKYGAGSLDLNGTDEFVSYSNSSAYDFGSGDFTIEAWVYQTAAAGSAAADRHPIVARMQAATDRSWHVGIVESSGAQALQFSFTTNGSSSTQYEFGGDVTINTWHHVAVVRNGSTVTCYLNGTALGTTGNIGTSSIYAGYSNLTVGYRGLSGQYFQGYIDDLRIIKGYALYTSNFVAPTSAVGTTAEVSSTVVERKFLSSVWDSEDVSEKMADGTWIRNDATSGANPAGVVVQGAGLEVSGHRWYVASPVSAVTVTIKTYGAGGGGGKHNGSKPSPLVGGDGGVNQATFSIPTGTELNVIVGQGGRGYQPGAGGTFGGGDGQGTTGPGQGGGGGGGYSGVFEGPATQGNALIIAGGGGGSAGNSPGQQGGDGGMNPFTAGTLPGAYSGNPGDQGSSNPGKTGGGGTVSAGGSSNSGTGSALQGGNSGPGNGGYNSSGGGGGGYYGGGAGTGYGLGTAQGSGGGGSAYTNTSAYSAVQEPNSNILSSLTQKSGGAGSFNSSDASNGADGSVEIIDGSGPTVFTYTGSVQTHTVS